MTPPERTQATGETASAQGEGRSLRVTDPCSCGHQIIAHSATDGCVYCDCDRRHVLTSPEPASGTSDYERIYDHYGPCWRCGVVRVHDESGLCLACERRSEQYAAYQNAHPSLPPDADE